MNIFSIVFDSFMESGKETVDELKSSFHNVSYEFQKTFSKDNLKKVFLKLYINKEANKWAKPALKVGLIFLFGLLPIFAILIAGIAGIIYLTTSLVGYEYFVFILLPLWMIISGYFTFFSMSYVSKIANKVDKL